ncbi:MAG: hypothetical protein JWO06_2126 [Bacteroidota bacterium]|nr:hypothetical protein [Bacteroidota bacterium]
MIKTLHFILLLSMAHLLSANDSTRVNTLNRLYAGASFTPGMTYRYINSVKLPTGSTEAIVQNAILSGRKQYEHPGFGFSAGLRMGININSFISIETGADYASYSYYSLRDVFLGSQWTGSGFDTTKTYKLKNAYIYQYINLPITLNFDLGHKKVKALISTGAFFNFLIAANSDNRLYLGHQVIQKSGNPIRNISAFNVSPFLGVGIDWNINRFMFLRVLPTAQMQVLANINGPFLTERIWNVGLNASLYFSFLKVK